MNMIYYIKRMMLLCILLLAGFFYIKCDTTIQAEITTFIEPQNRPVSVYKNKTSQSTWSPDGTKLAFVGYENAGTTEFIKYSILNNSKTTWFLVDDVCFGAAFSPDGKNLAYHTAQNCIWIYSMVDSSKIQLTREYDDVGNICWSPDGETIAYTAFVKSMGQYRDRIYIMDINGDIETPITHQKNVQYSDLDYSPDGSQIVALCTETTHFTYYAIHIISIETQELNEFFTSSSPIHAPAWSLDGSKIQYSLFDLTTDYNHFQFRSLDDSQTGDMCVANFYENNLRWASDKAKVIFKNGSYINSYFLDCCHLLRFYLPDHYYISHPSDDTLIVGHFPDQTSQINILSLNNNRVTPLTSDIYYNDLHPSWYKDQIIFEREGLLCISREDGTGFRYLLKDFPVEQHNPEFRRQDGKIIFDDGIDLYLTSLDMGTAINLSESIQESLSQPTWAPDGNQIACDASDELKIFYLENNHLIQTVSLKGSFSHPHWSTEDPFGDSHIIAEKGHIYAISPKDLQPFLIILGGKFPNWAPNGIDISYMFENQIYVATVFQELNK